MAKYDLPKFTAPTRPAWQQQPIIRTPNYADIYARSFAATQRNVQAAFQPLQQAVDLFIKEKEKEKQGEITSVARAEAYRDSIYSSITQEGAGDFEEELEDFLHSNVDAWYQNEKAFLVDESVDIDTWRKTRRKLTDELYLIERAGRQLNKTSKLYAEYGENLSLANDFKMAGLFESFGERGNIKIGRDEKGGLGLKYKSNVTNEWEAFTVKDLAEYNGEDALLTKIDFDNEQGDVYKLFNQRKDNLLLEIGSPEGKEIQKPLMDGKTTSITTVKTFTDEQEREGKDKLYNDDIINSWWNSAGERYWKDNLVGLENGEKKLTNYADEIIEFSNGLFSKEDKGKIAQLINAWLPTELEFMNVDKLGFSEEQLNKIVELQNGMAKRHMIDYEVWDKHLAILQQPLDKTFKIDDKPVQNIQKLFDEEWASNINNVNGLIRYHKGMHAPTQDNGQAHEQFISNILRDNNVTLEIVGGEETEDDWYYDVIVEENAEGERDGKLREKYKIYPDQFESGVLRMYNDLYGIKADAERVWSGWNDFTSAGENNPYRNTEEARFYNNLQLAKSGQDTIEYDDNPFIPNNNIPVGFVPFEEGQYLSSFTDLSTEKFTIKTDGEWDPRYIKISQELGWGMPNKHTGEWMPNWPGVNKYGRDETMGFLNRIQANRGTLIFADYTVSEKLLYEANWDAGGRDAYNKDEEGRFLKQKANDKALKELKAEWDITKTSTDLWTGRDKMTDEQFEAFKTAYTDAGVSLPEDYDINDITYVDYVKYQYFSLGGNVWDLEYGSE